MKNSNKNWEEQMKQILDEQEIVFEETDWKAAQALIQAANLHVPTEKKKRKGLGWFWAVLLGGILFGYMIGSGHFSTNKVTAKNEHLPQNEGIAKKENMAKIQVGALALAKESEPSAKAEAPIQSKSAEKKEIYLLEKTEKNVAIIPFTKTNQTAISTENTVKEPEKQAGFIAQTGTILDNEQVKNIFPRTINTEQKINLKQNNLPQNNDKTLIIKPLENKKRHSFFHKISANVYAGSAYSQRPYLNSTFYGGINLIYSLSPKWKLNLFGNYSERKVDFTATNVSASQNNGFNNTSADTVPDYTNTTIPNPISLGSQIITTEQIYLRAARYIGGGVGVSFQHKRHEFFANVSYHYLLNTQSRYSVNIVENQSLVYQDSKSINTFVAGINMTDIGLGLGYQYHLTRKIQVQIALSKGFKDMSNDAFYLNEIKHRNFQLQTGISYRLF